MKITELPETVWEHYWEKVYNRIERSVAWFIFILGTCIISLYGIFKVVTEPNINTFVGLGTILALVGFAILFLSVLREKHNVNKIDRYMSEIKR